MLNIERLAKKLTTQNHAIKITKEQIKLYESVNRTNMNTADASAVLDVISEYQRKLARQEKARDRTQLELKLAQGDPSQLQLPTPTPKPAKG